MTRARPLGESLRRGALAAAANPVLLLAPVGTALATAASVGLPVALCAAFVLRDARMRALGSGGDSLRETVLQTIDELGRSPVAITVTFAALLVLGTLAMLLTAYLRAGATFVLVAADRQAPPRAAHPAFRVPREEFRRGGRAFFWRFFWLLNLYVTAVMVLVLVFVVAIAGVVLGGLRGLVLPGVLLVLLALPLVIAGAVLARLAMHAAGREIVAADVPLMDGVGAGIDTLRQTLGPSVVLMLVLIAGGLVLAGVFGAPRLGATLLTSFSPRFAIVTAVLSGWFIVLQMLAGCAYDVIVSAAYVALWGGGEAEPLPPRAPEEVSVA